MSAATGLIYCMGQRDGHWTLEASTGRPGGAVFYRSTLARDQEQQLLRRHRDWPGRVGVVGHVWWHLAVSFAVDRAGRGAGW